MTEQPVQEPVAPENERTPELTKSENERATPDAKYTDKDVDKLKGAARKEGKQTAINELLGELEVDSVGDIKELVQAFKTVEEESATEADKERKAREKAETKLKELEPYKAQAERYAATIEEEVTAQMEGLPDYIPPLLEGRDPVDKLTWLRENREKAIAPTETTPQAPRGVPPTPRAHETSQTTQDAAAQKARQDARRSSRSRI